jgi:chaperonin GroES
MNVRPLRSDSRSAPRGTASRRHHHPDSAATVIAAGNGKVHDDGDRVKLDVKAGDTILFGKYSGQEIKLDGMEYLIMKEEEVLAAIEGVSAKATATKTASTKTATTRKGR